MCKLNLQHTMLCVRFCLKYKKINDKLKRLFYSQDNDKKNFAALTLKGDAQRASLCMASVLPGSCECVFRK